jgi:GDP-4-dehydro-6-deoxy-D-mannose reductase
VPAASFFNISSAEVYGGSFLNGPVTEESLLIPRGVYANSKACTETIVAGVLPPATPLVTLRPFNHSGPGQDERFVLAAFAAQIARIEAGLQEPVMKVGNLDAQRDFLDVRDVIDAYMSLLHFSMHIPVRAVFNIATGKAHRIGDLLEMMRQRARKPFAIDMDPSRLRAAEIPLVTGTSERLTALTGWLPKRRIEDLIEAIMDDARVRVGRGDEINRA